MSRTTFALRACPAEDGRLSLWIDGRSLYAHAVIEGDAAIVQVAGRHATVRIIDPRHATATSDVSTGGLRSPMPGRVVLVHVKAGEHVKRGTPLLAIEAMKMEHVVTAPKDGRVDRIHVVAGAQVAEAVTLVDFTAD